MNAKHALPNHHAKVRWVMIKAKGIVKRETLEASLNKRFMKEKTRER